MPTQSINHCNLESFRGLCVAESMLKIVFQAKMEIKKPFRIYATAGTSEKPGLLGSDRKVYMCRGGLHCLQSLLRPMRKICNNEPPLMVEEVLYVAHAVLIAHR